MLLSLQPIFQIRSPLRMFPSMVRAAYEVGFPYNIPMHPSLSLRYSRALYDWYRTHENAPSPLIIDADDIMSSRDTVRELCIRAGLDPDSIKYEWDTRKADDPAKARFLSTVYASTGILPGLDSKGLKLEAEAAKWREEFGEKDGEELEKTVRAAWPDYEYLRSHRVVAPQTD